MQRQQQVCFELRERRQGYKVQKIIGCCGEGLIELKRDLPELYTMRKQLN